MYPRLVLMAPEVRKGMLDAVTYFKLWRTLLATCSRSVCTRGDHAVMMLS
jgi:adenosyl cobinamide kinase/adenosyl cobinamide phosphate guanylyltransferase